MLIILCRKRIESAAEGRSQQIEEQQGELNKERSKVLPVGRRNQTEREQIIFGKVVKYGRELQEIVIVTQK